jgi:hypothetical protein
MLTRSTPVSPSLADRHKTIWDGVDYYLSKGHERPIESTDKKGLRHDDVSHSLAPLTHFQHLLKTLINLST